MDEDNEHEIEVDEEEEQEPEYTYDDNNVDGDGDDDAMEYGYSSGEEEGDAASAAGAGGGGGGGRKNAASKVKAGGGGGGGGGGDASGGRGSSFGGGDDDVRVIDESELKELLNEVVQEISGVMDIPDGAATALLRHFSWNKERLFDQFYANPASVTEKVGINNAEKPAKVMDKAKTFSCRICTDEVRGAEAFSLPCNHFFCRDCWKGYLSSKVGEGPTCVYTTCPEHKCPQIVTEAIFQEFLDKDMLSRYEQFSLQSFVDINKRLRFCPGQDCNKIVKAPISCMCVKCGCGEVFCFKCGEEAHQPCSCEELRWWKEKCQNESETANWILANTKCCPKCSSRIEKNQGCNHMTCQNCKGEFCWICMGTWAEHGAQTGGYYRCNRYDPDKKDGVETDAARAKAELDRYLHYYQRYANHKQSQAFTEKQQDATEKRMVELQESCQGATWIDVQFLKTAMEQLIECRRVLKYTYVFGFYFKEGNAQKELFEHHQENLEKFTEHLSGLSEMPLDKMDRTDIINYTRVTGRYLKSLLQSIKDGLEDDGSFNTVNGEAGAAAGGASAGGAAGAASSSNSGGGAAKGKASASNAVNAAEAAAARRASLRGAASGTR